MVNIIESPSRVVPVMGANLAQEKTENSKTMSAKAVLQSRPNSHQFPERTLLLDEPIKIGRSVAKAKPAANNAIFDCKVLSRHHAILWYENGKFYLKDTKSSNGTFVNNHRLSKGSEESVPREVCSSDVVQFGVDVVEDFKKVAHGCVIATLILYLPDGKEAKPSAITADSDSVCTISLQEFCILRNCLEEASQREQQINAKLSSLLNAVNSAHEVVFQGWTTMVDEDILLQRLELLQGQLSTFSKNYTECDAKSDVRQLQDEKAQIEINAKQSVSKILKEKLDIEIQCADMERKANSMNSELESLKDLFVYKTEIDELLEKQDMQTYQIQELSDQLKTAEEELKARKGANVNSENNGEDKDELELVAMVDKLRVENDLIKEQCNVIKSKYENLKNANRLSEIEVEGPVADANRIYETLRHTLRNLREKFREVQDETPDIQATINRLSRDLQQTTINNEKHKTEKAILEKELIDLKGKLKADESIAEHFHCVESASYKKLTMFRDSVLVGNIISKSEIIKDIENNQTDECTLLKNMEIGSNPLEDKNDAHIQLCIYVATSLQEEIRKAAEAVRQSKNDKEITEEKLDTINKRYSAVSEALVSAENLSSCLKQRLATKEGFMQNKTMYLNDVMDHVTQLESATDHIHAQFYSLANNLTKERNESEKLKNELISLKSKSEAEEKLSEIGQESENRLELNSNTSTDVTIAKLSNENDVSSTEELNSSKEDAKDGLKNEGQKTTIKSLVEGSEDSSTILNEKCVGLSESSSCNLEDQLTALQKENSRLRSQLNIQNEEFSDLAMRNQIAAALGILPLVILVLGFLTAFYETISLITATTEYI